MSSSVNFTKLYEFYDDYNTASSLPKIYNFLFGNDVSEERRLLISDIKTHNSIVGTTNTTSILNLLYFNKTKNDVQNEKAFYLNKFILNNLSGRQISELLKDDNIFNNIYFIKYTNDIINKNNHYHIEKLYKNELIMKLLYIFFMRGLRNNIFLRELKKTNLHDEFKQIIVNIFYYVRSIISNKNKEKLNIYKKKNISFRILDSELEKKIFTTIYDYKKVNNLISILEQKDTSISKNNKSISISPFNNSMRRKVIFDQLKNNENVRSLMIHNDTIEIKDTGKSYKPFVYEEEIDFEKEEPFDESDKAIRIFPNGKIYKFTETAYTFDMRID